MTFAIDINAELDAVLGQNGPPVISASALQALVVRVQDAMGHAKLLGALTLGELVLYSTIPHRAGLYVVFCAGVPVYVGSCRSQPYLVRLPAHLAAEKGDFLNSLTKARMRQNPAPNDLHQAAISVAADCSVLLLTVRQRWGSSKAERERFVSGLTALERALQRAIQSSWNNPMAKGSASQITSAAQPPPEGGAGAP